ncbi:MULTISPECIES: hypothetical protein [Sphingobium]|uniref:Uncharacterized protein n=1 Tax=Sphingobium chungbukense TaxID=56193 RepID=A0A0M3AQL8_9SPHN|nr:MULTISPECIES: hypothetical protein [Sphingobium]KKW90834.1 hypothetical protein YP76_19645 [Sphingobium chungbukense]PJG46787.1 hypothetical protein CAF53_20810 [Sphingobium sp. LB126]
MAPWYERWTAQIGLRLAGLLLLASAWPEGGLLRRLVLQNPAAGVDVTEFLLAALLFVSASAGAALIVMGPLLWKPVQLSARWSSSDGKERT